MFSDYNTMNTSLPFSWRLPLAIILSAVLITGCDSDSGIEDQVQLSDTIRVSDLPADPIVGFVEGRPVGTGAYTFYSLRDTHVVSESDSVSTKWDIALRGTTILVNGGLAGPGSGAIQIIEGLFEEIRTAPELGWRVDTETTPAVTPGSGSGWYSYNPAIMVISPIPGRVILVKTANGLYAKIRILSYYKGMPETPTAESESRYITFEYVIQGDGTRSFE